MRMYRKLESTGYRQPRITFATETNAADTHTA